MLFRSNVSHPPSHCEGCGHCRYKKAHTLHRQTHKHLYPSIEAVQKCSAISMRVKKQTAGKKEKACIDKKRESKQMEGEKNVCVYFVSVCDIWHKSSVCEFAKAETKQNGTTLQ